MAQTSLRERISAPLRALKQKLTLLGPRSRLGVLAIKQKQPSQPPKLPKPPKLIYQSDLWPNQPRSLNPFPAALEHKPYAFVSEKITLDRADPLYAFVGPNAILIRQVRFGAHLKEKNAIHMLPKSHNVCGFLNRKKYKLEEEYQAVIGQFIATSIENVSKHLFQRDESHRKWLGSVGITETNIGQVIRKAVELFLQPGSVTFLESEDNKLTMVILVRVDQIVEPQCIPPGDLKREFLAFVFGFYYELCQNPNSEEFPKTKVEQDLAAQTIWERVTLKKQVYLERWATRCRANPTRRLKSSTWDMFFKSECEQGKIDSITTQRLAMAWLFESGARFSKSPIMFTINPVNIRRSSDHQTVKLLMEENWELGEAEERLKGKAYPLRREES